MHNTYTMAMYACCLVTELLTQQLQHHHNPYSCMYAYMLITSACIATCNTTTYSYMHLCNDQTNG